MRILLTTTILHNTARPHHVLLGCCVFVVRAPGPLSEQQMLDLVTKDGGFDGLLNGDDRITAKVIDAMLPRCRVIAKYGIGLDSIDVKYATAKKIPVLFTPGVNETTVAEHTIGLMIAVAKSFWFHAKSVKDGQWKRQTGSELIGKTLGVIGLGRIGKEVIKRASALGMTCVGQGNYWDEDFARQYNVERLPTREDVLRRADVVSLHTNLTPETREFVNKQTIALMKDGAILVNTGRGGLVVDQDVAEACRSGKLRGY